MSRPIQVKPADSESRTASALATTNMDKIANYLLAC